MLESGEEVMKLEFSVEKICQVLQVGFWIGPSGPVGFLASAEMDAHSFPR